MATHKVRPGERYKSKNKHGAIQVHNETDVTASYEVYFKAQGQRLIYTLPAGQRLYAAPYPTNGRRGKVNITNTGQATIKVEMLT